MDEACPYVRHWEVVASITEPGFLLSLAVWAPSDDLPLVLQLLRVGGGCLAVLGVV